MTTRTMSRFYITTPIYYVNALPHLGTFYTTVVADALARYHRARARSRGEDPKQSVFFLTGLDEHGQKIERIAREKAMDPQAYCDEIAAKFVQTWDRVGISRDRFIRTTDADHKAAAVEMWKRMQANRDAGGKPDIYEAEYDGMYCVGCEEAKSEDDVILENGEKLCPIHRTPVERIKEKNYFFNLPRYAQRLLRWYAEESEGRSPVQPISRLNEVREFVKAGLRPLSFSRATVKWGIPVPGDGQQTIYVWCDALTNYLTALGGPNAVQRGEGNGAFWPASHHLIAKDILRFHAVYWPAMLWSAGLEPPRQIFCHGYLNVKGQKISKSLPATRVDPNAIADGLGVDPLRYFVLREYALGGDGDFTYEALFQRYESDLGNDLGNLLNRTLSMAHKSLGGVLPPLRPRNETSEPAHQLKSVVEGAGAAATLSWEEFAPSKALDETWRMIRAGNIYIDQSAPWKLAKSGDLGALAEVLGNACEVLRRAALMVAPAMPEAAREILRQLGQSKDEGGWIAETWTGWPGGTLAKPKPVFPRLEPEQQAALIAKWVPGEPAVPTSTTAPGPAVTAPAATPSASAPADITIDDFAKIDLRAAKVLAAESVAKADKLLKLTLDVGGPEPRTVVSGIAPAYTPETIVGRTVIYLANLAPRKIRGVLSQGMILAAGDADVLGLSALDRDVAPGTKIR
jgi:methionyl-tRNA synthetase